MIFSILENHYGFLIMTSNRRSLPSTAGLVAFEAAARHGSCTGASTELFLTVGAISKQIHALEQIVGISLFVRVSRGLLLTEGGKVYLESIRPVIAQLAAATTRALTAHQTKRTLMLRVFPAIAERWLLPRFADFLERYPEVDVQFTTYLSSDRVATSTDAALKFGKGNWAGQKSEYLLGRKVVLVASPLLLKKHGSPLQPADVFNYTLLEHVEVPNAWNDLSIHMKVRKPQTERLIRHDYYSVLIRAAISGIGMALIPEALVTEELNSGVLVNPLNISYESQSGYYIVFPEDKVNDPALKLLREWLKEAAAS